MSAAGTSILLLVRRRDPALLRLLKFEYDECALCGVTWMLHLHHVVRRSHGGDDVRANIVCLCQRCHDDYHLRRNDGVGASLARHLLTSRQDAVDYIRGKLGEDAAKEWFNVHASG